MRILLACPYSWDAPGGVQVHVRELADRLLGRGHDVLVLTPGRKRPAEPWVRVVGRPIDIPYNRSSAPICPSPMSARRVGDELRSFRPDVVHAHEPLTPSTSFFVTLRARIPVVATFHSGASRSLLFDLAAPLLRRVARRISVRIAVSRAAESFAASRIGGVFRIVPNGTDVEAFAHATPIELPPGRRLLFVGRLDPRKGFRTAVRAFGLLAGRYEDLRLVAAGDGDDRDAVEALPPTVRERVHLAGHVPNRELPPYHAAADVFVAPSVGGESFGMVLVEAMAAGLPVVASDIAGYREVVRDGLDGILVAPEDPGALAEAVGRLLDDPSLAEGLSREARARAHEFSWEVVTGRLEAIYREAAGRENEEPLLA